MKRSGSGRGKSARWRKSELVLVRSLHSLLHHIFEFFQIFTG